MPLNATIHRSASVVLPLPARFVGSRRYSHRSDALPSAVKYSRVSLRNKATACRLVSRCSSSVSLTVRRTRSDESLLKVVESEIGSADESIEEFEEVLEGFPFKVDDNPDQQTVSLSREYHGEMINVEVDTSALITDQEDEDYQEDEEEEDDEYEVGDEDDDDEVDNDTDEDDDQSSVEMVVKVSKPGAPYLEFGVTAYTDEIVIESLSVRDPESAGVELPYEIDELNEDLQEALHKFLEIRGIKPSLKDFLYEYMDNKEHREYTKWLKSLKKFVEA